MCSDPCGAGSYVVPGGCAACGPQQLCPGFSIVLPALLADNASYSTSGSAAGSFGTGLSTPSAASSGVLVDYCSSQASAVGVSTSPAFASLSPTTIIVAIAILIALGIAVVALLAERSMDDDTVLGAAVRDKSSSAAQGIATLGARQPAATNCFKARLSELRACLKSTDLFAVKTPLKQGDSTVYHPTTLGGLCSIFGVIVIATVALVSIVARNANNVASVSALSILNPQTLAADLLKPLTPTVSSNMAGAPWTGIRVRIFSTAGGALPSCATPAAIPDAFVFGGLVGPAGWKNSSVSDCGDGRSALILTCSSCVFSSTSTLTIALPFQCQFLTIDAAAVDATGVLSFATFPVSSSSAMPNALLKNVSWTLAPVLDFLDDQIANSQSRGFQLISLAQSATFSSPTMSLAPLASSVVVTLTLPLQGYYSNTVRTQKITDLQLFNSIVGLAALMGAFGLVHSILYKANRIPAVHSVFSYVTKPRSRATLFSRGRRVFDQNRKTDAIVNPIFTSETQSSGQKTAFDPSPTASPAAM